MKTKLFLAGVAALAIAVPAGPAPAQTTSYYEICSPGQIPNPANPYYCIPETTPGKKKPKLSLKVKPKKDKSAPIRFKASGRLHNLKGVSKRAGCKGRVAIKVKQGNKTVLKKRAKVKRSCKYAKKLKIKTSKLKAPKGKLKVSAKFGGNTRLKSAKAKSKTVKYVL